MTALRLLLLVVLVVAVPALAAAKSAGPAPISSLAAGEDGVWAWLSTYQLVRLDPESARVTHRTDTRPALVLGLAHGEGAVWGAGVCGRPCCRYGVLVRFDPATGHRIRPLTRLGLRPRAVAAGHGSVWVLGGRRVLRIDPRTRRVDAPPIPIGRAGRDIAIGAGAVWVTTGPRPARGGGPRCHLVGIDPRRAEVVRRQPLPCLPAALAAGSGSLWTTAHPGARGLARVRPGGGRVPLPGVRLPGESVDVAAGFGRAWVAGVDRVVAGRHGVRRGRTVVSSVDPATGRATRPLSLGRTLAWLPRVAVGAGAVWVANASTGAIVRVDPTTGAVTARTGPLDGG